MNILITGGAGYVGSVFVDYVLSTPWVLLDNLLKSSVPDIRIKVFDNLMYKQDGLVGMLGKYKDKLDFIYGDVRDYDSLEEHAEWADVILPLAALVGMPICEKDPSGALEINQNHVCHLAGYCEEKGKKIIYPNTNSGYGLGLGSSYCTEDTPLDPISVYGKTKCAAEKSVLYYKGIALRLATVFGVSPRMRLDLLVNDFTYKAATDGYVVLFEKDFKRNYIHVRDVAKAFCHMIVNYEKYRGQVFNLGLSDANLSKWELCLKIKEHVPHFSIQVDEIRKDPDQRNYIVSNEKIEKTGWSPEYSIDDGIKELLKAYKIINPVSKKYANA